MLGHDPFRGNATTWGERIKQYRNQKGLTLRNLAKELGVDHGTLASLEKGVGPSNRRIVKILRETVTDGGNSPPRFPEVPFSLILKLK